MTETETVRDVVRKELVRMADQHFEGEAVSEQAHALQTATLAAQAGARPALVAAALIHDIGMMPHVAATMPNAPHELVGAAFATKLLGREVGWLIAAHVPAKRALVATDPEYVKKLSSFSVNTLREQGGAAEETEIQRFLRHPLAPDAMQLRKWDDLAKDPNATNMALDELLDIAFPVAEPLMFDAAG